MMLRSRMHAIIAIKVMYFTTTALSLLGWEMAPSRNSSLQTAKLKLVHRHTASLSLCSVATTPPSLHPLLRDIPFISCIPGQ
jgi:hypothetical protein